MTDQPGIKEDDIVLDGGSKYRCLCIFCGAEVGEAEKPFRTFSMGATEDTCTFTGLAFVCPAHMESDGLTGAILARLTEIWIAG